MIAFAIDAITGYSVVPPRFVSRAGLAASVDSMVAGTRDPSLFACPCCAQLGDLFNVPVWSLRVELCGSVLVGG